jgi:hypothetical protein
MNMESQHKGLLNCLLTLCIELALSVACLPSTQRVRHFATPGRGWQTTMLLAIHTNKNKACFSLCAEMCMATLTGRMCTKSMASYDVFAQSPPIACRAQLPHSTILPSTHHP